MFGSLDPRNLMIIGGALLGIVVLAALGVQTVRVASWKADYATEVAERAKEKAIAEKVAREHVEKIAGLEAAHALSQQRLTDEFRTEKDAMEEAFVAAASDNDKLRADIERYTAARPAERDADPAICRDPSNRASTLGDILVRTDKFAEKVTRAAERHASEVRVLKAQIAADRLACSGIQP